MISDIIIFLTSAGILKLLLYLVTRKLYNNLTKATSDDLVHQGILGGLSIS